MYIHVQPFTTVWIDQKLDDKWKYLLCFIVADTAFLLGGAEFGMKELWSVRVYVDG